MTVFLGVDPGLGGACATYGFMPASLSLRVGIPGFLSVFDMPTTGDKTKRRVDAVLLTDLIMSTPPDFAIVEAVHSMPAQGVSSVFKFGQAFGTVLGVIGALKIPLKLVTPQSWKKYYGLRGSNKEDSRQRAIDLMPDASKHLARKMDDGRAEALLLARYGYETLPQGD